MSKQAARKVPGLRFPGFEGEWDCRLFGEVYSFRSTNSFSRDLLNYESGGVKNLHYGDIHTKFQCSFDITKETVPFINEAVSLSKIPEENYCKEKDLVIADASEDYSAIGKSIELVNLNGEKVVAGLHTFLARPDKSEAAIGFGGYLMQSYQVRSQIMTIAQGTKVLGISAGRLSKITLTLPTLPEQQKIATFLTAVDTKLQQLACKKALLEQYKKGVMQQLFSQQLRFKGENGEEFPAWEEKTLGEFLIPTFRAVDKPNGSYLAIGIRSHCKGTFQKADEDPTKNAMDTLYEVKENDLIVNITFAWEGAIAMVKKEDDGGLVSHRFPTYTFNRDLVIGEFFQYVYPQKRFRLMLELISPGGAGRNRVMSKSEFLKLKWEIPCLEEQQKIAAYLTALDGRIGRVGGQLEALRAWKKGLLQGMFV